jgi:Protein of unknown function (DUF4238)
MTPKPPPKDRPKHQHWVPQFYLRYFATPETRDSDKPQVWIFSKDQEDGNEKLTSVRNVCGKRYLYSPKQTDGERSWALDDRLGDIETLLSQVWPALANDFVDLSEQPIRKGLALFVALMHCRHPDVRREVQAIHKQLVEFHLSGPLLPDGTPNIESVEVNGKTHAMDTSDWHAYKNWRDDDLDRFFVDLIGSEAGRLAKLFLAKRWSVVFNECDTFVTTDKPVVLDHPTRDKFGFGTAGSIITFPLSPTRLLVLDDLYHEPQNQYYPLKDSNAGAFNYSVWRGASRFFITGRSVEAVLSEICTVADGETETSPLD